MAALGILVLGMHRSGTSAIAGALGRCGVELGENLIAPAADNPFGYFEHADAVAANEVLLDALDRAWDDIRPLPAGWMTSAAADAARSEITGLLDPLAAHPVWAIKDPRMCRLLPLWLPLLAQRAVEPIGVIALRHPESVAASLATRDRMPRRIALIAWLRHMLEAVTLSPVRSTVVRYDDLVADPVSTMEGLVERLGLPINVDAAVLRPFVDPKARHHARRTEMERGDLWGALAADVFAVLDSGDTWRTHLPGLQARFNDLAAAETAWIEVIGQLQRAAHLRRRQDFDACIAAESRAEALQSALDEARDVFEQEALRSIERLKHAEELQCELTRTQSTFAAEEARSVGRLQQAEALRAELALVYEAFAREEARSIQRLHESEALNAELARLQDAFAAEEARSLERLQQAEALRTELDLVHEAFAREEARSIQRLHDAETLNAELARLQDAFAAEEARSIQRLHEAEALNAELSRLQAAFAAEEERSVQRLVWGQGLQQELDRAEQDLRDLSHLFETELEEKIAAIFAADEQLAELGDRCAVLESENAALQSRVHDLENRGFRDQLRSLIHRRLAR